MRNLAGLVVAIGIGLGLVCSGCAQKPSASTSTVEATVSGVVTFDGKPITEGEVTFDPSNYQRKKEIARTAPIGADGRYTIRTLVGYNSVQVSSPQLAKNTVSAASAEGGGLENAAMGVGYELLDCEVKAGENNFDIELHQATSGLRG
jgi:hypothetical protein